MTARFSIVDEMPNKGAVAWKELVQALRLHWDAGTDTLLETPFYAPLGKPETAMDRIRKIRELAAYRDQYIRKKDCHSPSRRLVTKQEFLPVQSNGTPQNSMIIGTI